MTTEDLERLICEACIEGERDLRAWQLQIDLLYLALQFLCRYLWTALAWEMRS